jgi:NADH-quinone oxidoreductase subunit G
VSLEVTGLTTIYIDNRAREVSADRNLLEVCLSLRLDLPYFCWHPALGSVGACRQCAVKVFHSENDTKGRLVMACMTPVIKGMRISIEDPEAKEFRAGIVQGMMQSHPHDCPVCDVGGECHLQDMTVMTGHNYRHYSFPKRTFRNQYLGPFLNHEMNRCIQCYRCVRFYREYAGGKDFDVFGIRNTVYFGRQADGVLENEFAGNLVEVCPTGVFTDKTLRQHYTRKWDLQMAPSICVHCGLGCNTTAGERYGLLRRILNRYNGAVNGYFLCDRGRYGYEFVNSERRIRAPQLRREGRLENVTKAEALGRLGNLLTPNAKVIGIGSPRASVEANFVLRALVGSEGFFAGFADGESRLIAKTLEILRSNPARATSLHDVEISDAVLILGEDVTNTAPRMALSLRQSVRQQPMQIAEKLKIPFWNDTAVRDALQDTKGPLFIATSSATKLDEVATETYRAAPDELARLGFAVAHALDPEAPQAPSMGFAMGSLAERIARALREARHPLVVSGVSSGNEAMLQAAANVSRALCKVGRPAALVLIVPECNSLGLALLAARPLEEAFQAVRDAEAETVIVLENDLYRRAPAKVVDEFLVTARHTVVLDYLANRTSEKAEIVLPAGSFAESDGTFVNSEGRAQRFFQTFVPEGDIQESWRWLCDAMAESGHPERRTWQKLDDVLSAISLEILAFAKIRAVAPSAAFRLAGQKIPREPHRYSGRTSMHANISVHEPKPPDDPDSPLSFSMEGNPDQPPPPLIPFFWTPGWNSIQAVNKFQDETAGSLHGGDPGLRLLEPAAIGTGSYQQAITQPFTARTGEWLIVPLYHIFGSEELAHHAPAVAELAPKPYVALSTEDADLLQCKAEEQVSVSLEGLVRRLPVLILPGLPCGIAGMPIGLSDAEWVLLPAWGRIERRP